MTDALLTVRSLRTLIERGPSVVRPVDGVSFTVGRGETVGVVGETGCGKTMMGLSLMRLLPQGGRIASGSVTLGSVDLTQLSDSEMRRLRGSRISMIFQDPMTSLNPTMPIGVQIGETVRIHQGQSRAASTRRAAEMLDLVGMPDPSRQLGRYPHELSGGMRQRAVIAMALACTPELLIADEPTTALDTTIQEQILALLDDLKSKLSMGVVLITHDMGVIAGRADRVLVMYAGRLVEVSPTDDLFNDPRHPYTEALMRAIPQMEMGQGQTLRATPGSPPDLSARLTVCRFSPRCPRATERCFKEDPALSNDGPEHLFACFNPVPPHQGLQAAAVDGARADRPARSDRQILELTDVHVEFPEGDGFFAGSGTVKAVSGVSLSVGTGEVFGLVGESGCGKTTLGRTIVGLQRPTRGVIKFEGTDLSTLRGRALRRKRRDLQFMFQDPHAALDPRMRVAASLREPLVVQRVGSASERRERIHQAVTDVGLSPTVLNRFPHEFSGGQRQRIGFARAIVLRPRVIVADEPVSALDASVQAQVLNLMISLRADLGLTYIIISHDLAVISYLCDRVGVMYLGKLVEIGPSQDIYTRPAHPYTAGLLEASPSANPALARAKREPSVRGELPSAVNPPTGCRFRTRCARAQERCSVEEPLPRAFDDGHLAACHFPLREPNVAGVIAR